MKQVHVVNSPTCNKLDYNFTQTSYETSFWANSDAHEINSIKIQTTRTQLIFLNSIQYNPGTTRWQKSSQMSFANDVNIKVHWMWTK